MKSFVLPFSDSVEMRFLNAHALQGPGFPDWQRSFVSGRQSPLFQLEHRIDRENPQLLISRVEFKALCEGPPGLVHGGASAALIDETMGVIAWHNQRPCVTEKLNIHYFRALPLSQPAYLAAWISKSTDKGVEVECGILNDGNKTMVAARGVFHELTQAQLASLIARMRKPDEIR